MTIYWLFVKYNLLWRYIFTLMKSVTAIKVTERERVTSYFLGYQFTWYSH